MREIRIENEDYLLFFIKNTLVFQNHIFKIISIDKQIQESYLYSMIFLN